MDAETKNRYLTSMLVRKAPCWRIYVRVCVRAHACMCVSEQHENCQSLEKRQTKRKCGDFHTVYRENCQSCKL